MAVTGRVDFDNTSVELDVIQYSVREDATPLSPGDSSGGVGSIEISARAVKDGAIDQRTARLLDKDVVLTDNGGIEYTPFQGRGTIFGHITQNTETGGRVNYSAMTLLSRLNTEKAAAAFYGVRRTDDLLTYRVNRSSNPSLETVTTGWGAYGGTGGTSAFTRSNTGVTAYVGTYHGRVTWTVASTGSGGANYILTPVVQGEVISASIRTRTSLANQCVRLSVEWRNASNTIIGTTNGTAIAIGNTEWSLAELENATAPANTASAAITLYAVNDSGFPGVYRNWANGDILYVDALMINSGEEVIDYHDGETADSQWLGTQHASQSQRTVRTPRDEGTDATLANAFRYYCGLVGIDESIISVDEQFEDIPVAYPAWTANVWNQLKALCSAVGAEIAMDKETIAFRAPRQHTIAFENSAEIVRKVDAEATALNVDIVNHRHRWGVNEVAYKTNSIHSLNPGEITSITVKTTASLGSVNNPNPTQSMQLNGQTAAAGEYAIMDSNNAQINPVWWSKQGGLIAAEISKDDPRDIILTITTPLEGNGYKGPFRIATQFAGKDVPALYITGEGVFPEPETIRIPTGATITQTSNEVAATINNIFINDRSQAVTRGVLAAMHAGGPRVSISGVLGYDIDGNGQEFGRVVGGRIKFDHGMYRLTSVQYTTSRITFDGNADTMFDDVTQAYSVTFDEQNTTYTGLNFTQANSFFTASTTFDNFNATIPVPSIDDFNAIYEGLSFNDHAVWPLIPERIVTNDEAGI